MTIDIARLKARWAWTTLLAIALLAVLAVLDADIKKASGYGILDLEFVNTAAEVNRITGAWAGADRLAQIGFLIGLDYLYMAAYGFGLFYGGLAAREAFAREPGLKRRILTVAAFAPLAGAALDVVENALEAKMLFAGATDPVAGFTYAVTMTKFALIDVGIVLSVAGLIGLFLGRLKRS